MEAEDLIEEIEIIEVDLPSKVSFFLLYSAFSLMTELIGMLNQRTECQILYYLRILFHLIA